MRRYEASGAESQFEPGSDSVLRNKLGITDPDVMEEVETGSLERMKSRSLAALDTDHRFTAKYICDLHLDWLGEIYAFAGKYRTVNVSKRFVFAVATYVPQMMSDLEKNQLREHMPCSGFDQQRLATALASVHAELLITHPSGKKTGGWLDGSPL